jgi:hypothetical protein
MGVPPEGTILEMELLIVKADDERLCSIDA